MRLVGCQYCKKARAFWAYDSHGSPHGSYGITHSEAKGGLCRYLDKLYLSNGNANNVRVYHRYVYLFRGNTLLTIIPLPNKFYALADKLQKQKGEVE